jgi:regulator of cell morphogenesis and NO signaling
MTAHHQDNAMVHRSLGEIAASLPGATAVFRKHKLDFCCGGDVPLETAAAARGIDAHALLHELEALQAPDTATEPRDNAALIDYILQRYHETHRRELPELVRLARKVEAVHAAHPNVPHGLADHLHRMLGELEMHMRKEELILFPVMLNRPGVVLDGPIFQMRHEHDEHGDALRRLEALTNDFTLPPGACRSWQALYTGAAKLADDLMEHIHLENNVLFPRFSANA